MASLPSSSRAIFLLPSAPLFFFFFIAVVLFSNVFHSCMAQVGRGTNTFDGHWYIDCGSNNSSTDSKNRTWVKDQHSVGGVKFALPGDVKFKGNLSDDVPEAVLKSTRFFDAVDPVMPHYVLPVTPEESYWVRFKFPFYNSKRDGSNANSTFHVFLDLLVIGTVNYSGSGRGELSLGSYDIITLEIWLLAFEPTMNFTFISDKGGAYVSSIEVMPLQKSEKISTVLLGVELFPPPLVVKLEHRINCGGPHISGTAELPYSFEKDKYYDLNENSTVVLANDVSITNPNITTLPLPIGVFKSQRMAAEGGNLTYKIPVSEGVKYLINVFWHEFQQNETSGIFAEINGKLIPLNQTSNTTFSPMGRRLNVSVDNEDAALEADDQKEIGTVRTDKLGTSLYAGNKKEGETISIVLAPSPRHGSFKPFISALEVYELISMYGKTYEDDVATLATVGEELVLAKYPLMGDPCIVPLDILTCDLRVRNASWPPRPAIVGFKLSALVAESEAPPATMANFTDLERLTLSRAYIKGPIPGDWQRLQKLQYLDLRNNYFSGDIPSWLATLPNLTHVHLDANSFSGKFPMQLYERLGKNFTWADNFNLCDTPGGNAPCGSLPAPSSQPNQPVASDADLSGNVPQSNFPASDPQRPAAPSSQRDSGTKARSSLFPLALVVAVISFMVLS